ncbi:uncharacterized protein [Eurosta solidaginis]|uniref:uncharacterized protein n=1 Tax=Eurosta solidaginis TaxID=178769 RepID=UPI0035313CB3
MGSFLSKKRYFKRFACKQTKSQGNHNDCAVNANIIKRCSTFGAESSSNFIFESPTKVASITKVLSESPKQSPTQNKHLKYDPVYALWKNAFEHTKLRSPRKVSPIKVDSTAQQPNMTGVVAGQLTPKGFPSYTVLRKNMNNKIELNEENDDKNSQSDVCRRLSFRMSLDCPLSPREAKRNENVIAAEKANENSYVNIIPNTKQINQVISEAEATDINVSVLDDSSSNLEYTPKFLAMMANEKAMVIQKFFKNIRPVHVTHSGDCRKPQMERQCLMTSSCGLPYQQTKNNIIANIATNELNSSYNIYKDYYFV